MSHETRANLNNWDTLLLWNIDKHNKCNDFTGTAGKESIISRINTATDAYTVVFLSEPVTM